MGINSIIEMINNTVRPIDKARPLFYDLGYNDACDDIIEQLRKMSDEISNNAKTELEKYVESIGGYDSNAWHDHSACDLYIKGFKAGRLANILSEPDRIIIDAIKSVRIECGLDGHDESIYTNISTYEAKKIYSAILSSKAL